MDGATDARVAGATRDSRPVPSVEGIHPRWWGRRCYIKHSAAAAVDRPAVLFALVEANDLEGDLLQGKLLANSADELECVCIGIGGGAQLNLNRFSGKVRKALLKFPVKNEGDIGIKLLLQLEELQLLPCPRTNLVHSQNNLVGASVMRQRVENTWMLQALQLCGNHW